MKSFTLIFLLIGCFGVLASLSAQTCPKDTTAPTVACKPLTANIMSVGISRETRVSFYLPEADLVKLGIFDAAGRLLHRQEEPFQPGKNAFIVQSSDLTANGILSYQVASAAGSAAGKMFMTRE